MNYKLFILIFAILFISACSSPNYDVIDNTVIMDDENVYLEVSPATLSGSGWVETEFVSKHYSGDIDFVYGFDRNDAVPTQAQIYHPRNITEVLNFTCPVEANVSYTINPNWLLCFNDNSIYDNETYYERINVLFNGSFNSGNLQTRTISYNHTYQSNWRTWNPDGYIDRNYAGMTRWYYSVNEPVTEGTTYRLRFYLSVPDGSSGKYSLALKPSSETIEQAINNNHFYMLDPWWTPFEGDLTDRWKFDSDTLNSISSRHFTETGSGEVASYIQGYNGDKAIYTKQKLLTISNAVATGMPIKGDETTPFTVNLFMAVSNTEVMGDAYYFIDTRTDVGSNEFRPTLFYNAITNKASFSIVTNAGTNGVTSSALSEDTSSPFMWHMVTATYDGANNMKLYIDGIADGTGTYTHGDVNANTGTVEMGLNINGVGDKGGMAVDDMTIYNDDLTAQEISDLYLYGGLINNVIRNPGFENSTSEDWVYSESDASWVDAGEQSAGVHDGTYSYKVSHDLSSGSTYAQIAQSNVDLTGVENITFYAIDGGGGTSGVSVWIDSTEIGGRITPADTYDSVPFNVSVPVGLRESGKTISFRFNVTLTNNVYIDDIIALTNDTTGGGSTGSIDIDLNLSPTIVTSTSQISCNGTANNTFDGSNINVTITSYNNGVLNGTEFFNDQTSPYTFTSSNTLFPLDYTIGDIWNCTVNAVDTNDSSINGTTSSIVTVQNSVPNFTHGNVEITMNYLDSNLIQFNCTDAETAGLNYSIINLTSDFVTPLTINDSTGIVNITNLNLYDTGNHSFNISCNDSVNVASVLLNTTITNQPPTTPNILSPANNTFTGDSVIVLNCSNATDPEGEVLNYEFWGNVTGTSHVLWANSTSTLYNLTLNQNTTYEWKCRANDNLSTSNFTDNRTITKIKSINVGNSCPSGETASFFFDFADEINLTALTTDRIDYVFHYGYSGNATVLSAFGTLLSSSNISICINSSNQYYYVDYGEIKYSKADYTDRSFYIFQNTRLTNSTVNNTLYELLAGQATSFLFEFRDTSLNPYAEKYVALLRWYPSLNSYKVVEMGKTDDKGQTIMRVKSEDVDYRVAIYELDGTLIKLLNPVRFACIESPCTYIAVIQDTSEDYTTFDNIQSTLTYNNNTGVWTFTWNDPSQSTQTMYLNITSERADSTTTVCSTNASGFTGVITCDTSAYSGTLRGIAYRQASPLRVILELVINTVSTAFRGTAGLFISLIIFITLVLIGIVSPIISILMGVVALVPAYFMGSINLVIFVGLAFIGVLVIHFMKRSA